MVKILDRISMWENGNFIPLNTNDGEGDSILQMDLDPLMWKMKGEWLAGVVMQGAWVL